MFLIVDKIPDAEEALPKQLPTTKSASIVRKKKMAGLDDDYRSNLLESGIKMR